MPQRGLGREREFLWVLQTELCNAFEAK
jgi:hypothetical protein